MANKNKLAGQEATDEELQQQKVERYNKYVTAMSPKTSAAKSLWHAFWVGGLICCIAQGMKYLYTVAFPELDKDMISNIVLMTVVAIAIILTGFGVWDKMARVGGAGCFLPITGFANAMVSASMEYKTEGLIMGTSTKMFTIVGPVIVNGVVWSTIAGIVRWLISLGGF